MVKIKSFGVALTASALSLSLLAPVGQASANTSEPQEIRIVVASANTEVTKKDLIKKFHELFPNKFNYLTENDFYLHTGHYFVEDETLRYSLSFSKTVNGKEEYGNINFYGEDLDVEYFSFDSQNKADALFPGKITKDEAEKTAIAFIQQMYKSTDYELDTNAYPYDYWSGSLLTEPIRYSFNFVKKKDGVEIANETMNVTVLGNGEISSFYKNISTVKSPTYDDVSKVKNKDEMLQKFKDSLTVDLQYQINTNYRTGKTDVNLVYLPSTKSINAITGQWQEATGYMVTAPKRTTIEKITTSPLQPKYNNITTEEAKKIAEELLSVESDKVKLAIQSVDEYENNGKSIISVQFMYSYKNGGYGTNLEFDKQTGEIIQYHNIKDSILDENGEKQDSASKITANEAEAKAIAYLTEFVPSYLQNYAKPMTEPYYEEEQGTYHLTFPRIVNGIMVAGDSISVSIADDGTLNSLYINQANVENWPSIDKVISNEEAKKLYQEALDVKLSYVNQPKQDHYDLVYSPIVKDKEWSYLDASTGQWTGVTQQETVDVSHPTAKAELNYLISNNILEVKDAKNFNANASISKGEALKTLIKSLTYFYEYDFRYNREGSSVSYGDIDSKHPLYSVVERAVAIGILDFSKESFDPDAPLTREELAVWQVRILDLQQAAKHSEIYKVGLEDADKISAEYAGHVALVNAMGLLKAENNHFYPNREVSYAELAVSTIALAYEFAQKGSYLRY